MITIIDYGMGNLRSVQKGFEKVGFAARVTSDPRDLSAADKLVLPGVEPIKAHVASGRPFLGICLGLQLLFSESEEFGLHKGLDIIPGRVVRFPADLRVAGENLKVPHMGWNQISIRRPSPILKGVADDASVYFVHSYYVVPDDPEVVATVTDYGIPFCSSIWRGNVMATQFHPEKSQQVGLTILKNFGELS
jgi:glutamine amidotransferase